MIAARAIGLLIGYCAGLFQTGVIYGKAQHRDLRKEGSKNAGMTNTIRVMGWKSGMIVLAGDLFKAVIAMIVVWLLFRSRYPDAVQMLELYAGLGAVLGHNFPFYLKFKGGKGIACTVGLICTYHALLIPICAICFFVAVIPTGFMSLGSIAMTLGFFVQVIVFGQMGLLRTASQFLAETYVIAGIITGLALFKHRGNIARLARGEENKFRPKKKGGKDAEEEAA